MVLSKSDILGADDLKIERVPVPEWPGKDGQPGIIVLRQMSAAESMAITKLMIDNSTDGMFIILAASAIDDNGERLFTMDDIEALRGKSMKVLDRLQRACLRLNSMLGDEQAALKKV